MTLRDQYLKEIEQIHKEYRRKVRRLNLWTTVAMLLWVAAVVTAYFLFF